MFVVFQNATATTFNNADAETVARALMRQVFQKDVRVVAYFQHVYDDEGRTRVEYLDVTVAHLTFTEALNATDADYRAMVEAGQDRLEAALNDTVAAGGYTLYSRDETDPLSALTSYEKMGVEDPRYLIQHFELDTVGTYVSDDMTDHREAARNMERFEKTA